MCMKSKQLEGLAEEKKPVILNQDQLQTAF